MVHKVRILIFSAILILLCILSFIHKGYVETNLIKTFLPQYVVNSTDIVSIANKSASLIKVVFEAENKSDLEELKEKFDNQLDTNYFEISSPDITKIFDKYLSQPTNFLSKNTRELLINNKYDEIYSKSLENLYNPTGLQFSTLDRDPYLLLDDFLLSNRKFSNNINYIDGKYYDFMNLKIRNDEALSPELSNKKVKKLINSQRKLSNKNSKIYLGGTPIHSYYTSTRSIIDINIIFILSSIMILFLTYRYFRNIKLIFPIAFSIMFGMLSGYVATKIWFNNFQVITMVFSTTLIGIGIDYSYHYFFKSTIDKEFIKNLSFSLLTTITSFAILYFTKIELLEQVAVFTVFGLIGIYTVVLFIYPCFKYSLPIKTYNPNRQMYKISLIILLILSLTGIIRFHFNDNLTSLYSPSKALLKAENLYNKISGDNTNAQIITVKGNSIEEIIKTEEKITENLKEDYISLSKFFPSDKKQRENFNLVKQLYNNNLDKFSNILTQKQINNLKNSKFIPVKFNNFYLNDLMLNTNTSMIVVFEDTKLNINEKNAQVVNIQSDIKHYMKKFRHLLLVLFPVVILLLYALLTCLYDYKKASAILTPPITGVLCSILLTSLIYGELNLFSIITMFLVLGFTIDYSIFRINTEEETESAIFVSCLTTTFSFLLLALCGFKMLSSMALVLFFGIATAYITGYLLFNKEDKTNKLIKNWFQISEQGAGTKRLQFSWFLYKIFGKNILYIIAFLMSFFTFIFATKIREYSKKYFKVIENQTGLKPNLINQFKHINSYANSLVDKMLVFSGNYNKKLIYFENDEDKQLLLDDINKNNGVFFICNHIGNIEILQTLLINEQTKLDSNTNIFMSDKQSKIFNEFLQTLKINFPIKIFLVENIRLNTGIELKENLDNGEIVFIAGDRLSENNDERHISAKLFSQNISLPQGTFKLAKLMDVSTYFISAIKVGKKYRVILEKQNSLEEKNLIANYTKFLERVIEINPFQFFHFYDFFN